MKVDTTYKMAFSNMEAVIVSASVCVIICFSASYMPSSESITITLETYGHLLLGHDERAAAEIDAFTASLELGN